MKVFVIDNYDSFTYNLVHLLKESGYLPEVKRNDQFELDEILEYDKILISPGPGIPDEAGKTKEVIKAFGNSKSILGICLGHQSIAEVYGGKLIQIDKVFHGVATATRIIDPTEALFKNVPDEIMVGRYHSWLVNPELPAGLIATALDKEKNIMALKHKELDMKGIQFHPESILTEHGKTMIDNWMTS